MLSIVIKNYNPSLATNILEITEQNYHDLFNSISQQEIKLIFHNEILVGWARVDTPAHSLYSGFVFIYITPQYRRKGIGSYVYKEIEKTFLSIGCNWWSSYPKFDGADVFALAVGFDYTNINHELEHNGNLVSINTEGIRKCSVSDFHEVTELWSTEYARMHTLLGFPFQRKELNDEEKKESYEDFCNNIDNYFVLETENKIVGMGSLFSSNSGIGSLAVDYKYAGRGYGTQLAAFLTNECIRRGNPHPIHDCEGKNENALHIYLKIGYSIKSTEYVAVHS